MGEIILFIMLIVVAVVVAHIINSRPDKAKTEKAIHELENKIAELRLDVNNAHHCIHSVFEATQQVYDYAKKIEKKCEDGGYK